VSTPPTLDEAARAYAADAGLRAGLAAGAVSGPRHAVPHESAVSLCGQDSLPLPGTLFPVARDVDGVCWQCVEATWALAVEAGYAEVRAEVR
jgi:hypothetical protein